MTSTKAPTESRTWTREDGYRITTDIKDIPIPRLMQIFNDKKFHWANAMPEADMKEMLKNSLMFSLYNDSPEQVGEVPKTQEPALPDLVGTARCVTDFVTFVWLTDVWVDPVHSGRGLGEWLLKCMEETTDAMPYLRRTMLLTSDWQRSVPWYKRILGMRVIESKATDLAIMEKIGRGNPLYSKQDSKD